MSNPAPGTLDSAAQVKLMSQVTALLQEAYGGAVIFSLTVGREVMRDGKEMLAVYTMGNVADPKTVLGLIGHAGQQIASGLRLRKLVMDEAEDAPKQ